MYPHSFTLLHACAPAQQPENAPPGGARMKGPWGAHILVA